MSLSFAQQQKVNPVKPDPISDRFFQISGGSGANRGLYIGDEGVFVIDTKMDKQSTDQTIEEIKKITGKPLKYIINTHSDGDHVNGNRYFPEEVIIIAHENCRNEFFHLIMN
jgi:glyoxylase-like metal-dependent hydrolase (beta-lactamase superfamily II)